LLKTISIRVIVSMHYYQFNIADYRKDTQHLTPIEHYIYRELIDWYYLDETPIPSKTQLVMRRLRLVSENNQELINVLEEYFTETENGWIHGRIEHEINTYKQRADIARANGSKGGRPKKPRKTKSVNLANPEITKGKANHKPLTINHKPNINIPFDEFWNVYPNKKGKTGAEKVWLKLTDDEREQALVDCVIRYAHTDKNYIPYGSTYVSRKYWLDELTNDTGPRYETHNRSNTRPESNHAKSIRRNIALAFADDG